jgi:hypothetical protein
VADIADREANRRARRSLPPGRLKQPHRAARVLQRPADERERRVHVDHLRIAEQRLQAADVINRIAQVTPDRVAEVVRMRLVVIAAK